MPADDFYARLLTPEERDLMSQAPVAPDLLGEIAFLRARLATLAGATSESPSSPAEAQLFRTMALLTRAVAVQSRLASADNTLADINEFIRATIMGAGSPPSAPLSDPEPCDESALSS